MPFQPLPDNTAQRPASSDIGLLVIRLIAAAAFFYYQLIHHLSQARLFVWEKADWELARQLGDLRLPIPGVLAVALVLLFTIGLLSVISGFFTRINALALLLLTGFVLIAPLELSSSLNPQALVLYIAVFLGLACGGAGRASLDYRLAGRKTRNSRSV